MPCNSIFRLIFSIQIIIMTYSQQILQESNIHPETIQICAFIFSDVNCTGSKFDVLNSNSTVIDHWPIRSIIINENCTISICDSSLMDECMEFEKSDQTCSHRKLRFAFQRKTNLSLVIGCQCTSENSTFQLTEEISRNYSSLLLLNDEYMSWFVEPFTKTGRQPYYGSGECAIFSLYVNGDRSVAYISVETIQDFNSYNYVSFVVKYIAVRKNCALLYCSERYFSGFCSLLTGWQNITNQTRTIRSASCRCDDDDYSQSFWTNNVLDADGKFSYMPGTMTPACAVLNQNKTNTEVESWVWLAEESILDLSKIGSFGYQSLHGFMIMTGPDCILIYCSEPNFSGHCQVMASSIYVNRIFDVASAKCFCGNSTRNTRTWFFADPPTLIRDHKTQRYAKRTCAFITENGNGTGGLTIMEDQDEFNVINNDTMVGYVNVRRGCYAKICNGANFRGHCSRMDGGRIYMPNNEIVTQQIRSIWCRCGYGTHIIDVHQDPDYTRLIIPGTGKKMCAVLTENDRNDADTLWITLGYNGLRGNADQFIFRHAFVKLHCVLVYCNKPKLTGICSKLTKGNNIAIEYQRKVAGSFECFCREEYEPDPFPGIEDALPLIIPNSENLTCGYLTEFSNATGRAVWLNTDESVTLSSSFSFRYVTTSSWCIMFHCAGEHLNGNCSLIRKNSYRNKSVFSTGWMSCFCPPYTAKLLHYGDGRTLNMETGEFTCAVLAAQPDQSGSRDWIHNKTVLAYDFRQFGKLAYLGIRDVCVMLHFSESNLNGDGQILTGGWYQLARYNLYADGSYFCTCDFPNDPAIQYSNGEKTIYSSVKTKQMDCAMLIEGYDIPSVTPWIREETIDDLLAVWNRTFEHIIVKRNCLLEYAFETHMKGERRSMLVGLNRPPDFKKKLVRSLKCQCQHNFGLPIISQWWPWVIIVISLVLLFGLIASAIRYRRNNYYSKLLQQLLQQLLFENLRIDAKELEIVHPMQIIGKGESSDVLLGSYAPTPKQKKTIVETALTTDVDQEQQKLKVALKKYRIDAPNSFDSVQSFFQESFVLSSLDHPNIVKLYGVCTNHPRANCILVLEYANGGSVTEFIKNEGNHLTNTDLSLIFEQTVSGCCYLTEKNILHCDISAGNVLIQKSSQGKQVTAKLADFGLARDLVAGQSTYIRRRGGKMHIRYAAPEVLKKKVLSEWSDVWSFGVFMWECYAQLSPADSRIAIKPYFEMDDDDDVIKFVINRGTLKEPSTSTPPKAFVVMQQCWAFEADARPTFTQLKHYLHTMKDGKGKDTGTEKNKPLASSDPIMNDAIVTESKTGGDRSEGSYSKNNGKQDADTMEMHEIINEPSSSTIGLGNTSRHHFRIIDM